MPYTLKQKLEQLRDTPAGADLPPFMKEWTEAHPNELWAGALHELAREAIAELDRLVVPLELNLRISKQGKEFVVDDPSLVGSPPCGYGRTMVSAVGDFFHVNQARLGINFEVDNSALKTELRRRKRELAKR